MRHKREPDTCHQIIRFSLQTRVACQATPLAAYGTAWSKPHPLVGAARAGCFRYSPKKLLPQELVPLKEKLSEGI